MELKTSYISKTVAEDSNSSTGTEFVDATQAINNDDSGSNHNEVRDEEAESSNKEYDIVQKDINFLKDSLGQFRRVGR